MSIKQILIFLLCALATTYTHAQQPQRRPTVGDHVILELTGDLAQKYVAAIGVPRPQRTSGLSIQTVATITQQRPDGKFRIEHSTPIHSDAKPKLLTLTIFVAPTEVTTDVVPANTAVYASPAVHQAGNPPATTKTEQTTFQLKMSDLNSAKLRTWALVDEQGKLAD